MSVGGTIASFFLVASCAAFVALVSTDIEQGLIAAGVLMAVWLLIVAWTGVQRRGRL